tara:strand:+ start:413 stop:1243 length:831 start_codon:yes stop_codon:yes gene_type:complete
MKLLKSQINELKKTFDLVKKEPFYIAVPSLIDIMFLLVLGYVGNFFLITKAAPLLEKIALIKKESAVASVEEYASAIMSQQSEIFPLAMQVMGIFFQLALSILILWIVFQGVNWYLASKFDNKKVKVWKFFKNFTVATIVIAIFEFIIALFYYNLTLKNVLGNNSPIVQLVVNSISIIALVVLYYFALINYSICYKYSLKRLELCKKTIMVGIKQYRDISLAILVLLLMFIILNYAIRIISLISVNLMLVVGVILVFPLIAFSRMYLIKIVNKKKN